ncbi:MAG TPA: hypothetical protein VM578_13170 [Candidatus Saccharimonadales bacterium]|nr:hypothetical protein [Candidatus Saccharimonadales bacterium]
MPNIVQTNHADGPWKILLKGSLLTLFLGTLLFCIVPTLAIRLLPMAGVVIR